MHGIFALPGNGLKYPLSHTSLALSGSFTRPRKVNWALC